MLKRFAIPSISGITCFKRSILIAEFESSVLSQFCIGCSGSFKNSSIKSCDLNTFLVNSVAPKLRMPNCGSGLKFIRRSGSFCPSADVLSSVNPKRETRPIVSLLSQPLLRIRLRHSMEIWSRVSSTLLSFLQLRQVARCESSASIDSKKHRDAY